VVLSKFRENLLVGRLKDIINESIARLLIMWKILAVMSSVIWSIRRSEFGPSLEFASRGRHNIDVQPDAPQHFWGPASALQGLALSCTIHNAPRASRLLRFWVKSQTPTPKSAQLTLNPDI
jgi:hypothetical protein